MRLFRLREIGGRDVVSSNVWEQLRVVVEYPRQLRPLWDCIGHDTDDCTPASRVVQVLDDAFDCRVQRVVSPYKYIVPWTPLEPSLSHKYLVLVHSFLAPINNRGN
jgi:hypothetical protein